MLTSRIKTINVLSMLFTVVLIKSMKKVIQKIFITIKRYSKIEDGLNVDCLNFQLTIMTLINLKN